MLKQKENKLSKILMLVLLVLVVVGFTIPGFLDFQEDPQFIQPRVCQADSDCYLICGEKPLAVLCYHNLCQQNACQEKALYPYGENQSGVQLEILVKGVKINLKEQAKKTNLTNFFVQFQEDSFTALAPYLTLNQVLDKLAMALDAQCLVIKQENHCQNKEHELSMFINGNISYSYGEYEIKDKDKIQIVYLANLPSVP